MRNATDPKQVNIKDVARDAGVSASTVSYVLNGSNKVSQPTKERVLESIRTLGYRRNRVAGALRRQRTNTIGVLLPDLGNPFYAEFLQGAERVATEEGFGLFFCDAGVGILEEVTWKYINFMLEQQVDAILIAQGQQLTPETASLLEASGVPTCYQMLEPQAHPYQLSSVGPDLSIGMREAVSYLVNLGHRRIACVGTRKEFDCPRFRTFVSAAEELALPVEDWQLIETQYASPEDGPDILRKVMKMPERPTAVVGAWDVVAAEVMYQARQFGLRVPEDISIIGTDDILLAARLYPPLTTIALPAFELGAAAIRLLLEQDDGDTRRVILPTSLVIRESCVRPQART